MIQSLLVEGRHLVRVQVRSGPPPAGFTPVRATLEDAYLLHVQEDAGLQGNAAVLAERALQGGAAR